MGQGEVMSVNDWNWPQWIAVVWIAFEIVMGLYQEGKEQKMPFVGISIRILKTIATILVLHAGGFW